MTLNRRILTVLVLPLLVMAGACSDTPTSASDVPGYSQTDVRPGTGAAAATGNLLGVQFHRLAVRPVEGRSERAGVRHVDREHRPLLIHSGRGAGYQRLGPGSCRNEGRRSQATCRPPVARVRDLQEQLHSSQRDAGVRHRAGKPPVDRLFLPDFEAHPPEHGRDVVRHLTLGTFHAVALEARAIGFPVNPQPRFHPDLQTPAKLPAPPACLYLDCLRAAGQRRRDPAGGDLLVVVGLRRGQRRTVIVRSALSVDSDAADRNANLAVDREEVGLEDAAEVKSRSIAARVDIKGLHVCALGTDVSVQPESAAEGKCRAGVRTVAVHHVAALEEQLIAIHAHSRPAEHDEPGRHGVPAARCRLYREIHRSLSKPDGWIGSTGVHDDIRDRLDEEQAQHILAGAAGLSRGRRLAALDDHHAPDRVADVDMDVGVHLGLTA